MTYRLYTKHAPLEECQYLVERSDGRGLQGRADTYEEALAGAATQTQLTEEPVLVFQLLTSNEHVWRWVEVASLTRKVWKEGPRHYVEQPRRPAPHEHTDPTWGIADQPTVNNTGDVVK